MACTLVDGGSEKELFARAHAGDTRGRDALVERFLPMARSVARRLKGTPERDDVLQVAALALVKAIDRYDPAYGTAFSSFAMPTISGELKRFFRDAGWGMRVPRGLQELSLSVESAVTEIEPSLGRTPTTSEIAGDEDTGFRSPTLGLEDPGYALVDDLASIGPAFAALSARERQVLWLRFGGDLTQSEIAAKVGVSQMHVSRLIRQALDTIAERCDAQDLAAA